MENQWLEETIEIRRVAKVVAGGKRLKMRAIVVVGDGQGRVGLGIGKGLEVADAVKKATLQARRNLVRVPIVEGTIPHAVTGKIGSTRILLRPASPGTGVVAGAAARVIIKVAGISDILAKAIGPTNPLNLAKATMNAFKKIKDPRRVAQVRGLALREVWPYPSLPGYPLEEHYE
ncbi:MAG: 30S ribosomal protein S5 [bacterium JZ-2024 1]